MNERGGPDEALGSAERRVRELLLLLDDQLPITDRALTDRVLSTARWQYTVRGALAVTGLLAAAVIDGVATLVGVNPPGGGER